MDVAKPLQVSFNYFSTARHDKFYKTTHGAMITEDRFLLLMKELIPMVDTVLVEIQVEKKSMH